MSFSSFSSPCWTNWQWSRLQVVFKTVHKWQYFFSLQTVGLAYYDSANCHSWFVIAINKLHFGCQSVGSVWVAWRLLKSQPLGSSCSVVIFFFSLFVSFFHAVAAKCLTSSLACDVMFWSLRRHLECNLAQWSKLYSVTFQIKVFTRIHTLFWVKKIMVFHCLFGNRYRTPLISIQYTIDVLSILGILNWNKKKPVSKNRWTEISW